MQGMWTSGALQGEDEEVGFPDPTVSPRSLDLIWLVLCMCEEYLLLTMCNRMVQFEAR